MGCVWQRVIFSGDKNDIISCLTNEESGCYLIVTPHLVDVGGEKTTRTNREAHDHAYLSVDDGNEGVDTHRLAWGTGAASGTIEPSGTLKSNLNLNLILCVFLFYFLNI